MAITYTFSYVEILGSLWISFLSMDEVVVNEIIDLVKKLMTGLDKILRFDFDYL